MDNIKSQKDIIFEAIEKVKACNKQMTFRDEPFDDGQLIIRLDSGCNIEIRRIYIDSALGRMQLYMKITKPDNEELRDDILIDSSRILKFSYPGNNEEIQEMFYKELGRLESECTELKNKINTVGLDAPDVWSYFDFLYFSTITQTTVGYGDILPNNTLVRLSVICQVIIGYIIVSFLINFSFF